MRQPKPAEHICFELPSHEVEGNLLQRPILAIAGVVDENADRAEFALDCFDRALARGLVSDIERQRAAADGAQIAESGDVSRGGEG